MIDQIKYKVQQLIAQDKTEDAIKLLLKKVNIKTELYDSILIQSSMFWRVKKKNLNGMMSNKEFNSEVTRINKVLCQIVSFFDEYQNRELLPNGIENMQPMFDSISFNYTSETDSKNKELDEPLLDKKEKFGNFNIIHLIQKIFDPFYFYFFKKTYSKNKKLKESFPYKKEKFDNFNVIHTIRKESHPFPILAFTIVNKTGSSQIITKLGIEIAQPLLTNSIPKTRRLETIVTWDIRLPLHQGYFEYIPINPVIIGDDDAGIIQTRFYVQIGGSIVPPAQVAIYLISITFISDERKIAKFKNIRL